MCVCACVCVCVCGGGHVLFIGIVCVQSSVCVCVCVCVRSCVFAMLCVKIFVNFHVLYTCKLYTTDLYNYGYLRIICFSLSCKVL